MSHWLLRIPLIIVFIQQGISKYPVNIEDAQSFELPFLVWWFVVYGELGSGFGLLVGGFWLSIFSQPSIIIFFDTLPIFCKNVFT